MPGSALAYNGDRHEHAFGPWAFGIWWDEKLLLGMFHNNLAQVRSLVNRSVFG